MKIAGTLVCALAVILLWGTAFAQDAAAPQPEAAPAVAAPAPAPDAALAKQLDAALTKLDAATRRIDELEAKVGAMGSQMGSTSENVNSLSTQMKQLEAKSAAPAAPAAAVRFQPYGYIKVDMVYDDTRTSGTDYTAFVLSEKAGYGSDKYFTITVRQTRLGVNINGPDVEGATSSGKIEVDFYAPASVENKAELMLRQAYWQLAYPNWNVLAGQTWEVVAPLFPNTLNYAYLALQGNIGYRKPMVRYERIDKVFGDKTLQTDVAIVRSVGQIPFSTASLDDEGSDSAWPVLEGRVGISIPTSIGRPVAIGLSGHVGQEEYDAVVLKAGPPASVSASSGKGPQFMTYSGCIDFKAPLAKDWDIIGEFFSGRNLDAYTGGIGQGVNTGYTQGATTFASALNKPIDAIGGWTQVSYRPKPEWLLGVGVGIDDPDNADLSGSVNRDRNATYFTNAIYNINSRTRVGLEVSFQNTRYLAAPDGDNVRVQSSLQYDF